MNIKHACRGILNQGEVVAYFGRAKLVKRLDCKFELCGGTREDHFAAREWVSMFMHEAVLLPPDKAGCA